MTGVRAGRDTTTSTIGTCKAQHRSIRRLIIDRLEVVEIEEQQGQGLLTVTRHTPDLGAHGLLEVVTIPEAGEPVGGGEALQFDIGGLERPV